MRDHCPDLIIHCAAQPSHDLAKDRPFDDFEVNAVGTLESPGGGPPPLPGGTLHLHEHQQGLWRRAQREAAWWSCRPAGITRIRRTTRGSTRTCRVDATLHSLFGASKLAADVMVQEYGRYFGMPTVCFRGGCLTGPNHSGAELHGFLAYLAKAVKEGRVYRIYGYKGKQVRDNIHSFDVCTAFLAFYERPRQAAIYNLGGGRGNSVSILEAIARFEEFMGKKLQVEYVERNRVGDHICYISDLRRLKADYPQWEITRSLENVFQGLAENPRP